MSEKLIKSIHVSNLFGLYTYTLPDNGNFSDAAILYGDNGVGKSTILRLAFHLLSSSNNRGHRGALFNANFEVLKVELAGGVTMDAKFVETDGMRELRLGISKDGKLQAIWDYRGQRAADELEGSNFFIMVDDAGRHLVRRHKKPHDNLIDSVQRGEKAYLKALEQYAPTLFILDSDRRLDSDSVANPSDEIELRRVMQFEDQKRINQLVVRSREIALSQAMYAARDWISKKAVIGANQGSMNVQSVYVDVLRHLISSPAQTMDDAQQMDMNALVKQLNAIESKTAELSHYEFATELSTVEFKKALGARAKRKSALAAELLKPYIRSLDGRLKALEPIYLVVDRFVKTVNGFLSDKALSFKLSQGFVIKNKLGHPLTPAQLSSGEQQLLLLFFYVLTARDVPSAFMIDEPEISLNIKWQRQLIQSLLDITEGATIQFIFASHSIELLAQHRNRVVKMASQ